MLGVRTPVFSVRRGVRTPVRALKYKAVRYYYCSFQKQILISG